MEIIALLQCLDPVLTQTTIRQFSRVLFALLAMTGRVTMLGLSRWAGQGGSYRTVQRFFSTVLPWAQMFWLFFRQHLLRPDDVYLLAGDEVVVTKAGKETFGLDRFFSGVTQKPLPGLAFFALSLVSTTQRRAFPLRVEQVVRTAEEKAARQAKANAKPTKAPSGKRPPGRPKGSKNKKKDEVTLSKELQHIQAMLQAALPLVGESLSLTYLALDGHFGHNAALQMARRCGLHLISKLRSDAALYFPYDGPPPRRGPRRKYGAKVDYRHLPERCLKQVSVEEGIEIRLYHALLLHKEFSQPLNVVIIVKTNLRTQAWAHALLFSSNLTLAWEKLVDYYRLRFQIEFNFRDAKQYWGLEDFMNTSETAVTNAANLSLFMVNVAYRLQRDLRPHDPAFSVLDLKAHYRGYKYVSETIKMLPQKPDENLVAEIFRCVARLGSIHSTAVPFTAP
jgi:hypothetical protein